MIILLFYLNVADINGIFKKGTVLPRLGSAPFLNSTYAGS